MGPRGYWIVLAIVLFYLIARPHVGTVWYVIFPPSPPLPSGAKPLPGFVPDTPPPPQGFADQQTCFAAESAFRQRGGVYQDAYCAPRYALLWGW